VGKEDDRLRILGNGEVAFEDGIMERNPHRMVDQDRVCTGTHGNAPF
jgi:hypothetical protein